MIVIDTHIWFWWVHDLPVLKPWMREAICDSEADQIGVSAISCWEIALAAKRGRMHIEMPLTEWFGYALSYPGVKIIPLTPEISTESVALPEPFHDDPADRFIVATARILDCKLLTADGKIRRYPDVSTFTSPDTP
jgi:PIN domain nuclease of toxin-antitoxin system